MSYEQDLQNNITRLTSDLRAEKVKNAALEAEIKDLKASKSAEISARAASAERARIKAIITSPEAEHRQAQARVFAFESEITETLAAQLLAAQPKDATAPRIPSIAERAAESQFNAEAAVGGAGYGGDWMADRRSASDPLTAAVKSLNDAARSR